MLEAAAAPEGLAPGEQEWVLTFEEAAQRYKLGPRRVIPYTVTPRLVDTAQLMGLSVSIVMYPKFGTPLKYSEEGRCSCLRSDRLLCSDSLLLALVFLLCFFFF